MFRYILFGGRNYYAKGGAHDFRGGFQNLQQAELEGAYLHNGPESEIDWWHVFDTHTGRIIAGTNDQALGAPDLEDIL